MPALNIDHFASLLAACHDAEEDAKSQRARAERAEASIVATEARAERAEAECRAMREVLARIVSLDGGTFADDCMASIARAALNPSPAGEK